ncbi:hypothetical protein A8990_10464 [Paenibacillus taihuensis]|uniref:Uncharacterized protein n=1 Tax=Paenibacillus taihuensis TaxID=1156355 RepID=A0A3D9SCD6_9BACL|nr:hypothetical protein A8990_10464 [Paenibacillus taihuensis]
MRLLIIAPEQLPVPSFKRGSVENCIYQIAKKVSDKHQITIVYSKLVTKLNSAYFMANNKKYKVDWN